MLPRENSEKKVRGLLPRSGAYDLSIASSDENSEK